MRAAQGGGRASPDHASIRRLPVSRKATNPRLTRLESVVLTVLLVTLSVIVLVGVSGATRSGAVAACDANVAAVSNGLAALKAENSGPLPTTSSGWERALLVQGPFIGSPFLTSWPRSTDYAVSVAGAGARVDAGDAVTPKNGDVLVTLLTKHHVYDATLHVGAGCATL